MKSKVISAAFGFILVFSALLIGNNAKYAHGQAAKLMSPSKPSAVTALAFQDWNGNVYGGYTSANVVDHNSAAMSGGSWSYYLELLNTTWSTFVGMEYDASGSTGVCGTGTGLNFFYQISKNGTVQAFHCYTPTQKQIGRTVQFGVSYYVTNGPGIFVWITNTADSNNQFCNPCAYDAGSHPTYTDMDLDIDMSGVTFNAGGGNSMNSPVFFVGNEWISTSGVTSFQGSAGSQTSPNPPSIGIQISPASEDGGGMIFGCAPDTTVSSC